MDIKLLFFVAGKRIRYSFVAVWIRIRSLVECIEKLNLLNPTLKWFKKKNKNKNRWQNVSDLYKRWLVKLESIKDAKITFYMCQKTVL